MTHEALLQPSEVEMHYDVARWRADGTPSDVSAYRLEQPGKFRFELSADGAREIQAALKVWTFTLRGLTKMVTRIQMAWQVRACTRLGEGEIASAA
jgi:hypothetical protein